MVELTSSPNNALSPSFPSYTIFESILMTLKENFKYVLTYYEIHSLDLSCKLNNTAMSSRHRAIKIHINWNELPQRLFIQSSIIRYLKY